CHLPRAPRSDGGTGAPIAGACPVHLPTGVRAVVGWSPQRRHPDARSTRSLQRRKHGRTGDRRARAARRSDETDRRQDRWQPTFRRGTHENGFGSGHPGREPRWLSARRAPAPPPPPRDPSAPLFGPPPPPPPPPRSPPPPPP